MGTLVENAMMREAAKLIERNGVGITAEFIEGRGAIVLSLTEKPFAELVIEPRKPA